MGCLASKVKPSATGVDSPELPDDAEKQDAEANETKEERKERKRLKKELKKLQEEEGVAVTETKGERKESEEVVDPPKVEPAEVEQTPRPSLGPSQSQGSEDEKKAKLRQDLLNMYREVQATAKSVGDRNMDLEKTMKARSVRPSEMRTGENEDMLGQEREDKQKQASRPRAKTDNPVDKEKEISMTEEEVAALKEKNLQMQADLKIRMEKMALKSRELAELKKLKSKNSESEIDKLRERKKDLQESSSKLRRKSQELIEQYDLDMDIADRY